MLDDVGAGDKSGEGGKEVDGVAHREVGRAVADGDEAAVAAEHRELVRTIDKAAARGALHKNTAARKKAQAQRLVSGSAVAV